MHAGLVAEGDVLDAEEGFLIPGAHPRPARPRVITKRTSLGFDEALRGTPVTWATAPSSGKSPV